jgi:nitrogen fixation-related uncharacterized protein
MYFPYFATYMIVGLGLALLVAGWALHNGQFGDQQRARFLPLAGDPPATDAPALTRRGRLEVYGLALVVAIGLAGTVAVLAFALLSG